MASLYNAITTTTRPKSDCWYRQGDTFNVYRVERIHAYEQRTVLQEFTLEDVDNYGITIVQATNRTITVDNVDFSDQFFQDYTIKSTKITYPEPKHTEEKDSNMTKLYLTKDGNRYGEYVAIDSNGKIVLNMKDTGNYEGFAEDAIERVMPFTYDVTFLSGSDSRSARSYSYTGTKGSVEVGDLLILDDAFSLARVIAVDTKSDAANKTFKGRKLATVAL